MSGKNQIIISICVILISAAGCRRDKPRQTIPLAVSCITDVINYDSTASLRGINCITGSKYYDMHGQMLRTRKGSLCVEIDSNTYAGKYGNGLFALFDQKDDTI